MTLYVFTLGLEDFLIDYLQRLSTCSGLIQYTNTHLLSFDFISIKVTLLFYLMSNIEYNILFPWSFVVAESGRFSKEIIIFNSFSITCIPSYHNFQFDPVILNSTLMFITI